MSQRKRRFLAQQEKARMLANLRSWGCATLEDVGRVVRFRVLIQQEAAHQREAEVFQREE